MAVGPFWGDGPLCSSRTLTTEDTAKTLKLIGDAMQMGATDNGRTWVVSALHPAHNDEIRPKGIPDEDVSSTVHLVYKLRRVIKPPVVVGKTVLTWDVRLVSQCNPLAPVCIQLLALCTDGTLYSHSQETIYNRQALGGLATTAEDGATNWFAHVSKWRCTKASVTGTLDAPLTASQGTWMAANVPCLAQVGTYTGAIGRLGCPAYNYLSNTYEPDSAAMRPQPGFARGPMGGEEGGFYALSNLDPVVESWVGQTQRCMLTSEEPDAEIPSADYPYPYRNGTDDNGDAVEGLHGPSITQVATAKVGAVISGQFAFPNNNRWVTHVIVTGMSAEANLVLDIIQGWECVVFPGTEYAQFAQTSPAFDPQALAAYHEIRRRLLDAYPASYNDWDKLWSVIKGIAHVVLPFVGALGPIGAGLAVAGSSAISVVDAISARKAKKKGAASPLAKAMTPQPRTVVTRGSTTTVRK